MNAFIGWLFIIIGIVIIIVAAAALIIRLLAVFLALILIKQGMQLLGASPMRIAMQWWFKNRF
jgi:hypothetical protein